MGILVLVEKIICNVKALGEFSKCIWRTPYTYEKSIPPGKEEGCLLIDVRLLPLSWTKCKNLPHPKHHDLYMFMCRVKPQGEGIPKVRG
jgi:hypothetical protein